MNWAWAASLDQFWRSPSFPMWLTLAAAGFFAIIAIITLVKAEKSVANGALTVITLLAVGIAVAATTRGFGPAGRNGASETSPPAQPASAALPALSCIDDLAGETVLTACEKALFGSPESTAAALSYAAAQLTRVTALGDAAAATGSMTTEQLAVRRAVEHDRYGLMAYVLAVRDHCTSSECAAFRALSDRRQVAANMDEHVYEGLVARYAPSWNAPAPVAALSSPPLVGKPTNADFPSAASTPPVNIMGPEPGTTPPPAPRPPASLASAPLPSPRPTSTAAPTAAKKPSAPKTAHAPAQLVPAQAAPAPSND